MRKFIKNHWRILLPEILVIIIFSVFYQSFGDIIVDSYREVYIPQEMLNGKILYKDIFVIYPPLAYLINAFLMKFTGLHTVAVLKFAGLISTMGIVYLTHTISDIFLTKKYSVIINLFIIASFVLSPNVFNAFLPYSYGILYGMVFVLLSLYFAIQKRFPLTYLFYSLAILSKYEFLLLFPLLVIWSGRKNIKQNLFALFLPIISVITILFIQGIRWHDICTASNIVNIMSGTRTLYWFYSIMGLTFRWELIPIYIADFIKFIFPINWVRYQEILVWSCPVILIGTCLRYKQLCKTEILFLISTLLVSLKVFFALTIQSYGVYFLPLVLISLCILIPSKIRRYFCGLLIIWSLIIGTFNTNKLLHGINELPVITKYIQENTSVSDKVLIYPEGLFLNTKTNRKSDTKFYSLIPLYVETFGENTIIKRLESIKAEYIIISNYDTSAYYFKEFGVDYANKIYDWINNNYNLEKVIEDSWKFQIYHKK